MGSQITPLPSFDALSTICLLLGVTALPFHAAQVSVQAESECPPPLLKQDEASV
jgi:hypothetical protein